MIYVGHLRRIVLSPLCVRQGERVAHLLPSSNFLKGHTQSHTQVFKIQSQVQSKVIDDQEEQKKFFFCCKIR